MDGVRGLFRIRQRKPREICAMITILLALASLELSTSQSLSPYALAKAVLQGLCFVFTVMAIALQWTYPDSVPLRWRALGCGTYRPTSRLRELCGYSRRVRENMAQRAGKPCLLARLVTPNRVADESDWRSLRSAGRRMAGCASTASSPTKIAPSNEGLRARWSYPLFVKVYRPGDYMETA